MAPSKSPCDYWDYNIGFGWSWHLIAALPKGIYMRSWSLRAALIPATAASTRMFRTEITPKLPLRICTARAFLVRAFPALENERATKTSVACDVVRAILCSNLPSASHPARAGVLDSQQEPQTSLVLRATKFEEIELQIRFWRG